MLFTTKWSAYDGQAQHPSQANECCDTTSSPPVPVAGQVPLSPAVASPLEPPLSAGTVNAVPLTPAVPPVARAIPPPLHVPVPIITRLPAVMASTAAAAARNSMRIVSAAPVPVLARRLAPYAPGLPPALPRPVPRPGTIPRSPVVRISASAALVPARRATRSMSLVRPLVACAAMAVRVLVPVACRRARRRDGLARALGRGLRGL